MNDDAKFFFFLSGFIGFIFFYGFSLVLNHDPLQSLIYGSIGSLFFSLSWRMLLCSALKKVQCAKKVKLDLISTTPLIPKLFRIKRPMLQVAI